jgi:DNA-binding transcriptional LysR family regulator
LEQRVDGAFVCGPVTHPDLDEQPMFREELVMLTAPDVPSLDAVLNAGEVRLVVLRAGCSYRQMLEALLARRGIVVLRQLEFGTLEAIFGCVSAGLGITALPRALVGGVCDAGRVAVHTLPPEDAMVETMFIRRRNGFASSALRAFLACVGGG